jgi:hypothetical protein
LPQQPPLPLAGAAIFGNPYYRYRISPDAYYKVFLSVIAVDFYPHRIANMQRPQYNLKVLPVFRRPPFAFQIKTRQPEPPIEVDRLSPV